MTVAVTGATGYVGRALVERLRAAGVAVRAIVRNPQAALPEGVERAVADLTRPTGLDALLRGADVVVHCAAEQRSSSRARHRLVNVAGTRAVTEAAALAGVRRLVHLSSVAVYPRRDGGPAVTPDEPLEAFPELRDAYAWSKIGAERWVAFARRAGLDAVTLRLGIVYGRERDFVARVWRRLVGPIVLVAGSQHALLPLVPVDDVTEAIWRVVDARRVPASALHVVGPDTPTQGTYLARRAVHRRQRLLPIYVSLGVVRRLSDRCAWRHASRRLDRPSRAYALAWAVQTARYDLRSTERALGWAPRIGFEEGLRGPDRSHTIVMAVAG